MDDATIIENMAAVWRSIERVCAGLDEAQWALPTDCPGWSVQDNLSHMAGSESTLLGRPQPDHVPGNAGTLRNALAERNEVLVDYRRSWTGDTVLAEFREVTAARLDALRAMSPAEWGAESWTPVGPGTYRDFMLIRVFDCWVHEQDMRRALSRPGSLEGAPAEHAMERIASAMSYVVGKRAGAPEGASVVFDITGPVRNTLPIGVEGGRARPLASVPEQPTTRLSTDFETFMCLSCGRWDPAMILSEGRMRISGDEALGRTITENLNFMM